MKYAIGQEVMFNGGRWIIEEIRQGSTLIRSMGGGMKYLPEEPRYKLASMADVFATIDARESVIEPVPTSTIPRGQG